MIEYSTDPATGNFTVKIPYADLPAPGEVAEYATPSGLILLENTTAPEEEIGEPTAAELAASEEPLITYSVVDVIGATRTHAAIVRRHSERTRVNRFPLCSRSNTRQVRKRLRDQPLTAVTCVQCRRRLEAEGEL